MGNDMIADLILENKDRREGLIREYHLLLQNQKHINLPTSTEIIELASDISHIAKDIARCEDRSQVLVRIRALLV